MMSQFSASSPPLNFKALGDDFETLGTEVKLDSTQHLMLPGLPDM